MVAKLIGEIDGREVIFSRRLGQSNDRGHSGGDVWDATIPADLDGEYVVAIRAVDEAGNEAYIATMLFTVDPSGLCATVEMLRYYVTVCDADIGCEVQTDAYPIAVVEQFGCEVAVSDYALTVIQCGGKMNE